MKKRPSVEVPPDAGRAMVGLRDTGYDFNTAVADLIDNSIAANASLVDVRLDMDLRGRLRLSIADNGAGMDYDGLINAMKYGSKQRADPASLGKFGLGLKTASTAFCRRLMLTSRMSPDLEIIRAIWDIDHVEEIGKWDLDFDDSDKETIEHLNKMAGKRSGTVVVWEKVDRLIKDYTNPSGVSARKAFKRMEESLREHVAMIYQRFLDRSNREATDITIIINSVPVEPWDPFCKTESDLVASDTIDVEGTEASFKVDAWVLPRKEEFSSVEAGVAAKISNDNQGFYIYRENRLIHFADWMGMFSKEPHGSLLRIEFSFDHRLDKAFQIDIKKKHILLNTALYDLLKEQFLPAPRRAADARSRQGQNRKARENAAGAHAVSNNNIASKEGQISGAQVTPVAGKEDECLVKNAQGEFRYKLTITESRHPGEVYIQPADSLDGNVLFEPALIDQHKAVRINTSHPYYHKVYVPNLKSGVTIQGMDSLLWALCMAEFSTVDKNTLNHFEDLRYELSRVLKRLVADLPDPKFDDDETI